LRPDLFGGAVDGRCLRHVQDDRTDPGVLGGIGLELIRPTAGRKHHVPACARQTTVARPILPNALVSTMDREATRLPGSARSIARFQGW
jgi:hypothetical protein